MNPKKFLSNLFLSWQSRYQWTIDFVFNERKDTTRMVTHWGNINLLTPIPNHDVKVTFLVRFEEENGETVGVVTFQIEDERLVYDVAELPRKNIDHLITATLKFKRDLAAKCPIDFALVGHQRINTGDIEMSTATSTTSAVLIQTQSKLVRVLNGFFRENRNGTSMDIKKVPEILRVTPFSIDERTLKTLLSILADIQSGTQTPNMINEEEFSALADEIVRSILDTDPDCKASLDPEEVFAKAQGMTKKEMISMLTRSFDTMDTNNDSTVTGHQIMILLKSLKLPSPLTPEQMENMTSTLGATTKLPELLQEWKRVITDIVSGKVMSSDELLLFLEDLLEPAKLGKKSLDVHKCQRILLSDKTLHLSPMSLAVMLALRVDQKGDLPIQGLYTFLASKIIRFRDSAIRNLVATNRPATPILAVDMLSNSDQKQVMEALRLKFVQHATPEEEGLNAQQFKDMLLGMKLQLSIPQMQILLAPFGNNKSHMMYFEEFVAKSVPTLLTILREESSKRAQSARRKEASARAQSSRS
ncbi:hypothetical protein AAMO2058_000100900 [Amorphochlora amoebiformis]